MTISTSASPARSSRKKWLRRFCAGCAVPALLSAPAGFAEAQPVERVPLYFPAIEPAPPGKRHALGEHKYQNIVYDAPLIRETEVRLAEVTPSMRRRRDYATGMAEARWLSMLTEDLAALLDPVDRPQVGSLAMNWREALGSDFRRTKLFTENVMAAIAEAPPVLECVYDQGPALPEDLQKHMWAMGPLKVVEVAFWTGPAPDAIAPEALRDFGGPDDGMHPLIVVGPPIASCPETLGAALETMAAQFPGQVPAAEPPPPGDPRLAETGAAAEAAEPNEPREPAETTLARLAGMALAVTRTDPRGRTTNRDYIVVDRLDPDGPAAQAGFRSGDYLRMVGWSHHETVESFAQALAEAEERKAVVLSRRPRGRSDHQAALVVFADAPPGPMVEMPRDTASTGRTVLVDKGWQTLSVPGGDWCAPHVEVVDAMDIGADELVPISAGAGLREAFARIEADCPQTETVSILRMSSRLDAPITF